MKRSTPAAVATIALLLSPAAHADNGVHDLAVAQGFDYATDRQVTVRLQVYDHQGLPATGRMVEILDANGGGRRLESGTTDAYGMYEGTVTLPIHFDQVTVRANVLGIANQATVAVQDQRVEHVLR